MAPVPRFLIQRLDLLSIFDIVAGLLTLTALFAWLNHRYLGLPNNVSLLLMGLAVALFTLVVQGLTLPLVVKRFAHQAPKAEAK